MQRDDEARADVPPPSHGHLESHLERRDERPSGEPPHRHRTRCPAQAIARHRAVGVGVPRVTFVLEAQQATVALPRTTVVYRQGACSLEPDLDPAIRERAPPPSPPHHRAARRRQRLRLDEGERRETEPGHSRDSEPHPHTVDFVLVGVVAPRLEALEHCRPAEHLDRDRATLRRQGERPVPGPCAHHALRRGGGADGHIAPEQRDVGHHDPPARACGGVPDRERRLLGLGGRARSIRIVADEVVHAAAHDLARQGFRTRESYVERARDGIADATRDRIMKLAAHQRSPREVDERSAIPTSPSGITRERSQRIGEPLQPQLDLGVAPLERGPRAVDSLERPRVPVRPPQLAAQCGGLAGLRALKELLEP